MLLRAEIFRDGKSTGTVVDEVDRARWDDIAALEKLEPGEVLVMTTDCKRDPRAVNFDDIGGLLQRMNIPYTGCTKQEFEEGKVDLTGVVAILLTCTLCVWKAADALREWVYEQPGMGEHTVNPVVGEINDAVVNNMWAQPIGREQVFEALLTIIVELIHSSHNLCLTKLHEV